MTPRLLAASLLLLALGSRVYAAGEQPPSALLSARLPQQPGAPNEKPGDLKLEGELTAIDPQNHFLWVRSSDGRQMRITYTAQTEIVGAGESSEGLMDRNGSQVRVFYQILAGVNVATKIEILPMQAVALGSGSGQAERAAG